MEIILDSLGRSNLTIRNPLSTTVQETSDNEDQGQRNPVLLALKMEESNHEFRHMGNLYMLSKAKQTNSYFPKLQKGT